MVKIYLVGGAVRDGLLNRAVKERDWVVVGATPEQMIALGYRPVGKGFPVFLHPKTHEEYALARTERKVARGYQGFDFYATPDVTLEEDLKRRDLTINAIAQDKEGHLIDPYHGQDDLQAKVFRHVSSAFAEDPVRILRLGRFSARYVDFHVHADTQSLLDKMVQSGEVDALVANRVWSEFSRALEEKDPRRFIDLLQSCGAWQRLFPGWQCGQESLQCCKRACDLTGKAVIRFAALAYDLDESVWRNFKKSYPISNYYIQLTELIRRWFPSYADLLKSDSLHILYFIKGIDAVRRAERLVDFLMLCEIIDDTLPHQIIIHHLRCALGAMAGVDIKALVSQGFSATDLATAIEQEQLLAIEKICQVGSGRNF